MFLPAPGHSVSTGIRVETGKRPVHVSSCDAGRGLAKKSGDAGLFLIACW
nr:hypothetical protein [uncultured Methanoregula sp.]